MEDRADKVDLKGKCLLSVHCGKVDSAPKEDGSCFGYTVDTPAILAECLYKMAIHGSILTYQLRQPEGSSCLHKVLLSSKFLHSVAS